MANKKSKKNKREINVKGGRVNFNRWERRATKEALEWQGFDYDDDREVFDNTFFPAYSEATWRKDYKQGLSAKDMGKKVSDKMDEIGWIY